MSQKPEVYISVDIEASGPIPAEFNMLSLGACVVGKTNQSFYAEIKPLNGNFIERAMEVNGLSLTELQTSGEEPAQAVGRFAQWVAEICGEENRPVFVAFNATFDWSFCHWYFMKFLGRDPFGISGLDMKAYFMGMKHCFWSGTVKKKVRALYPATTAHTHNALDDAREQAEIFEKMMK